ncbi:MAG: hypothetical protein LQ346_001576 [Caloplaca aetnensis]|nr:MAG: hypothetical protein LQ346_001576 [Caloplaca aetnensis]
MPNVAHSPLVISSRLTPSPKSASPNVQQVALGDIVFRTWYPSYYPEEIVGRDIDRLYVCQWCFKYCRELSKKVSLVTAVAKANCNSQKLCQARVEPPPGRLIYLKGDYTIYEVDGEEDQLFCQNLSLFAKLFLDNKSVFFDVASFNYYLLVLSPPDDPHAEGQSQVIGFFSKEKMSWDNNNLACILVFPPWQRKGLGKILMGLSYELSRLDDRVGGPEKPLSELGRIGYLKFWQARVAKAILEMKNKTTLSVEEIAAACWMLSEDVVSTLREMDVLGTKRKNDGSIVVSKARVREWVTSNKVDLAPPVDEDGFAEDYLVEEEV